VIIDQFVASGEAKWNVKNGLVMLLPHGYDGQGPEHSSSRAERFLQLTNQDDEVPFGGDLKYNNKDILRETNLQVVNCSTAANYFHLLRTQMRLPFRKPLVVVAPKKLLRLKGACSTMEDFAPGTRFLPLISDKNPNLLQPKQVKKVILCSG
jgi:2-oxoglutarate dehydrogenase E1 component